MIPLSLHACNCRTQPAQSGLFFIRTNGQFSNKKLVQTDASNTYGKNSMRRILAATLSSLALLTVASNAHASCFGSDTYKTCTDNSGNSYSVQKYGNSTYVQGTNAQGESWSQQSQTYGNTTYHNGTAKDGNSWNGTTSTFGGTTVHQGTDSRGNGYYKSCNQYGCY